MSSFTRKLIGIAGVAVLATPAVAVAHPGHELPPSSDFQKVTLDDFPGEPIALAVLPDRRVLHTARSGEVRIHEPSTGRNVLAAKIPVYLHDEEGVQGVAIDSDFEHNKWVYIYYSPVLNTPVDDPTTPTVNEGDAPSEGTAADFAPFKGVMRLSRFKLSGNTLRLTTEQKIIEVATDRGMCCHVGGKIDFDRSGNLFLSTGDDTNPFFSSGYAPLDERANRNPAFDSQRTAGNTNDLRGKLLRIKVGSHGGYTIPRGNLFRPGTPKTRPEIYAMGLRNPFRFTLAPDSDTVYLADYSPDAQAADPLRGPAGQGRWMAIDKPANYGWPYCVAPDQPYVDYDFATGVSGAPFNCAAPVNESPHNTGLRRLPPVEKAEIIYSYGASSAWPELGTGGIGPMGGPAYDYDARSRSRVKWPSSFDGLPLFAEWTRDYVKAFHLDRRNQVTQIDPVLPEIVFDNPMDLEFGPDGALYVLEYGDGYFSENPDAQLARIDYVRGNRTPIPRASANPGNGQAPLTVRFSSAGTVDPDGDALRYAWDFDADGRVDSTELNPVHTYTVNGNYRPTLKVTDSTGRSASAEVILPVGTAAPQVTFVTPVAGQPFAFGQTVNYEVTVADDAPVDCARVTVTYILGHDQHGHPLSTSSGCTGSITTFVDAGHAGADNLTAVFVASYTDTGTPPQTGSATVVLTPSA
ncbi:PQQ-dependent sugar dehydrogenase [Actinoplanes sp. HUAS TT8]|uniref:PQQ-dependent sugar dehydrogenase n=1 Tax=Actinoplanes sp. HUAS TT8 TaxID=3447453 RepID=UPI003F52863A